MRQLGLDERRQAFIGNICTSSVTERADVPADGVNMNAQRVPADAEASRPAARGCIWRRGILLGDKLCGVLCFLTVRRKSYG